MPTDLFHRAIVMSGSSLSSLAVVQDPSQYALRLGAQLGCAEPGDAAANHELLVDCLREQSVERLLGADVGGFQFLPTFGPSVDRVVVPATVRRGARRNQGEVYSLMFGVAERDAADMLSDGDLREGMSLDRRDRLLRAFVRNTHCYSNVEIFYSIINAYTEWGRTRRGDKERRDETLAALTDAAFVAPVTADADLHAPLEASPKDADPTFFYVFSHQRKGTATGAAEEVSRRDGKARCCEPFWPTGHKCVLCMQAPTAQMDRSCCFRRSVHMIITRRIVGLSIVPGDICSPPLHVWRYISALAHGKPRTAA